MQDVSKTIQKLRALAAGSGNEAETAKMILGQLLKQHPQVALFDAKEKEIWIPTKDKHRHLLTVALGQYLGCKLKHYKKTPKRGVFVCGEASVVASFPGILKQLQRRLEKMLYGASVGFVLGALPLPDDGCPSDEPKTASTLSDEELQAALMGQSVGRKATPRRALEAAALPGMG